MKPLAFRAHQKQLELLVDVDGGLPDRLVGDPRRLRQILVNLVGNAIKFTDARRSRRPGRGASRRRRVMARLHFSVIDTGIGIPEDKQASDLPGVHAGRRLDHAHASAAPDWG